MYEWIQRMPFDYWLVFVVTVIPLFIGIYQLHHEKDRKAAKAFLFGTISIVGALVWIFFGKPKLENRNDDIKVSPVLRSWVKIGSEPWVNAWPNMIREPEEVPTTDHAGSNDSRSLELTVEGVVLTSDHTVIHVAVKNLAQATVNLLPATGSYLLDDQNQPYDFQSEGRPGDGAFFLTGEIRPYVVERFQLLFPPMRSTSFITLKHAQFLPITIYQYKPVPGIVSFCRPHHFNKMVLYDMDVSCDGEHEVFLSDGNSEKVQLHPGKHVCKLKYKLFSKPVSDPFDLQIFPGKEHYVKAEYDIGLVTATLVLKPANSAVQCMAEQ